MADQRIAIPAGKVGLSSTASNVRIGHLDAHHAVCAFIDILGFRSLVNDAFASEGRDRQALADVLEFLSKKAHEERARLGSDAPFFRATTFSDSIVISDESSDAGISNVTHVAAQVAASLLWRGRLCRGGISEGMLIHTDHVLLGPALVAAYDIEQSVAVYPRIVIKDSLLRKSPKDEWQILLGADGLSYIDVFHRMSRIRWKGNAQYEDLRAAGREIGKMLEKLKATSNLGVLGKYRWAAIQFNEFAERHKQIGLEKIELPGIS